MQTLQDVTLVHETEDDMGPIQVRDEGLIRSLYFGNDNRQSSQLRTHPDLLVLKYTQVLSSFLLFNSQPARVLVFGLGGGTLPRFILRHCPNTYVDVVELRPKVSEVAEKFFQLPRDKRLRIIHSDVHQFLAIPANLQHRYDVIIFDCFDANGPVDGMFNYRSLQQAQHICSAHGIVVINFWNREHDQIADKHRLMQQVFTPGYHSLSVRRRNSNIVFFGFCSGKNSQLEHSKHLSTELQNRLGIDYPGFRRRLQREKRLQFLSRLGF